MSDSLTVTTPAVRETRTREAIARAAEQTGADFSYLLAQAKLESSLDPSARARTSSAAGLYQFIDSTWLSTLDRHGHALGLGGLADAIEMRGGRARIMDPTLRDSIMALRYDPDASALMAGALAGDNRAALLPVLGREPDAAELYLAHFLGAGGATKFLGALSGDPHASAAALLPQAAAANRGIFHAPGGAPRSIGEVMSLIREKVQVAMAGESEAGGFAPDAATSARFAEAQAGWRQGWAGQTGRQTPGNGLPPAKAPPRPSMAETLASSFALVENAGSPAARDHVRNAYGKLKAFGL